LRLAANAQGNRIGIIENGWVKSEIYGISGRRSAAAVTGQYDGRESFLGGCLALQGIGRKF